MYYSCTVERKILVPVLYRILLHNSSTLSAFSISESLMRFASRVLKDKPVLYCTVPGRTSSILDESYGL